MLGSFMDIQKYLERINYTGYLNPGAEVLSSLQLAHLMTVPFENLDIYYKVPIDVDNLFDKIVNRRRGGFCYELNGLFYQLLSALGFTVKMISAGVYNHKKEYSPEYDHMALLVTIKNDNYLVDVGFGEFSHSPVNMKLNTETVDSTGIFKVEGPDENYHVVKKKNANGEFIPEYRFSLSERKLHDFDARCLFHQTSSESHFMQNRICSLPIKNGRITLTGNTLKITANGIVKETHLDNEQAVRQALWNYFKIKL